MQLAASSMFSCVYIYKLTFSCFRSCKNIFNFHLTVSSTNKSHDKFTVSFWILLPSSLSYPRSIRLPMDSGSDRSCHQHSHPTYTASIPPSSICMSQLVMQDWLHYLPHSGSIGEWKYGLDLCAGSQAWVQVFILRLHWLTNCGRCLCCAWKGHWVLLLVWL